MKVKAKVNQPSPDEIIKEYLDNNTIPLFVHPEGIDCLTEEGKACLSIGIKVYQSFSNSKRK